MLREARAEFVGALADALDRQGWPRHEDLALEDPPEDVDAIVATSVAFRLAGDVGEAPQAIARQLAEAIETAGLGYIARVEAVDAYVNAHPTDRYHLETLAAAADRDFGRLPAREDAVVVEHTSANPTGPVHIGRGRNPIIGDALARLLDAAGHDVETHYYVNDAGRQIALFTWAFETFDASSLPEPERDRIEYDMVRYYRRGNAYLEAADVEETERIEAEIEAIMRGLEDGDEATYERVAAVVDRVLDGMRQSLARLPVTFDEFVKETRFMFDGSTRDVVQRLQQAPEAERDADAWQLDLQAYDIDKEFVFVRSDGTTLYTTRDIAHHEWKFERFDRAITVLGEGQELHAKQLHAALEILGHDTDRLEELFYGWVSLPGGEGMSTRKGTGVDLDELLDEAIDRAHAEVTARLDDRGRDDELDEAAIDRIARQVGIGAVRYDIVSTQPAKPITFEWERALDFEANSAPYVQYVHARSCGILDRVDPVGVDPAPPGHPAEVALCETIAAFPLAIERAADRRAPHRMAAYLQNLADTFNAFYRDCSVVEATGTTRATRRALVRATRTTVAGGLDLLGIEAPTSM